MNFVPVSDGGGSVLEIEVAEPGLGRLAVRRHDDRFAGSAPSDDGWALFAGGDMWRLLDAVAGLCVGPSAHPTVRLRPTAGPTLTLAADEGRWLLRPMFQAVLAAAAGTDRYQRIVTGPDVTTPAPLCARCGAGSSGGNTAPCCDTPGCDSPGCDHVPFGIAPGTLWAPAGPEVFPAFGTTRGASPCVSQSVD